MVVCGPHLVDEKYADDDYETLQDNQESFDNRLPPGALTSIFEPIPSDAYAVGRINIGWFVLHTADSSICDERRMVSLTNTHCYNVQSGKLELLFCCCWHTVPPQHDDEKHVLKDWNDTSTSQQVFKYLLVFKILVISLDTLVSP